MGRFRSTAVLVLLFVALFSYFWIYQKDKKAPEPTPDPASAPLESVALATFKADDLAEISWKSASYSATIQNSSGWKLTQPSLPSDPIKVKSYVDSVVSLSGSRKYDSKDLSASETGLDKPSLTVILQKKDNSSETIKVGNKTVDGDYYYATRDGFDAITLLGTYVIDDINKDPNTLKPDPASASPVSSTSGFTPAGSTSPQF